MPKRRILECSVEIKPLSLGEHIINEDRRDDVDGHESDISMEGREEAENVQQPSTIKKGLLKLPTLLFYFAILVYYVFNDAVLKMERPENRVAHNMSAAQGVVA